MFQPDYTYKCILIRVIDGDTVVLRVDLGFKIQIDLTVRLADFNAPEPRGKTKKEGLRYKAKAQVWFDMHPGPFFITTQKSGKYGRWLGRIFVNLPEDDDGRTAQGYLTDHLRIDWKYPHGVE